MASKRRDLSTIWRRLVDFLPHQWGLVDHDSYITIHDEKFNTRCRLLTKTKVNLLAADSTDIVEVLDFTGAGWIDQPGWAQRFVDRLEPALQRLETRDERDPA
jgi:hypothetical protein